MTQKIAVVGATGRVGEHVVDVLREQGFFRGIGARGPARDRFQRLLVPVVA